jgi:NADH:ubiquinone oxidoreductase subunit 4 (subunit M)
VFFGPVNGFIIKFSDLNERESFLIFILVFVLFFMGIFPNFFLSEVGGAVFSLVKSS